MDRGNPDDVECQSRSCFDAKTWVNKFGKKKNQTHGSADIVTNGSEEAPRRSDCPVDKDELGRNTWSFLHTMAAGYPEKPTQQQQQDMKTMMHMFAKFYPCDYCAKDFRKSLKKYEPDTRDQHSFSQWMCQMHNIVNVQIGKPEFDCSLVNERWKDGWKDGSCD